MSSRALAKLKAVLIIDIVIIAAVGGAYLYLQSQNAFAPKPAEFILSGLTITPLEPDLGEPVTITFNVTNIGGVEGGYPVNFTVNNVFRENQTIAVPPGGTVTAQFTTAETIEGNYQVKIGDLSGQFTVKAAPLEDTTVILSDLKIEPREVWVGNPLNITVIARNQGAENDSLSVRLMIDDLFVENNRITLAAGEITTVQFHVNSTNEGSHKVRVNTLFGTFKTVPVGTHTLTIYTSPTPDEGFVEFKLNGETVRTPFAEALPEGTYSIALPSTDTTGTHPFLYWEDGSTSPSRTITLTKPTILVGYYEKGDSCPSLFVWNGTQNVYLAEVSNHGWLGYINYMNADGSIVFYRNNPWDYIPIAGSQMQPIDGYYQMTLMQLWDEIFYLDQAYMVAVDHPANVDVFSTLVEEYLDSAFMGKIYTVSSNPLTPLSATNEKGQNVLSQISKVDNVFTQGMTGLKSQSWNNLSWNTLTLKLPNLSGAEQIKLVARGMVDWGEAEDYNNWIGGFYGAVEQGILPDGTQITPPPYMEVRDANGNWIRIQESRQIPIPPDRVPRTFVVDLTGLFPTGITEYWLRINNFWNVTFDYIAIDTTAQAPTSIQKIYPIAELYQQFPTSSASSGAFTKYGDVTQLVLNEDDLFVIGRQGDAVVLQYSTAGLQPVAEGMVRDYFFFVSCWFKDENGNWGFGFGFTSDPLPFSTMSGFPYPSDEAYPTDAAHLRYISEWNTRIIPAQ
ncbi:MAG TPA: CARDB domain-containing protein [Candidatus Bathyarchaeia archaeon]